MTFHDEVLHKLEVDAYQSVRQLQLWLCTVAPLRTESCECILKELHSLCVGMNWSLVHEEQIGWDILKKITIEG